MNLILATLAGPIGSILTPALTVLIGKIVLNVRSKVDALPVAAKQAAIVVIAGALTALQSVLGVDICGGQACAPDTLVIPTLATAAVAFLMHAVIDLRKQAK